MTVTAKRRRNRELTVELPEKVLPLIASNKRHKVIVGGRAKAASWSIARICLTKGMESPKFIVCVREVQKSIKNSVKKLLDEQIEMLGLTSFYKSTDTYIRGANGTEFVFYGLKDHTADNIKSVEGADICWVAEAQSLSRRSVNVLRPTIRKEGSEFWWDFNPRYETDPVWVDYIDNEDPYAIVLWLNWRDNPWFSEAVRQEKEADYARNEEEARHIWEGELRKMGDKFVCPSTLVDKAREQEYINETGIIMVGADIAHQGGDEIVFYKRIGPNTVDRYISKYQSAVKTVADLKAFTQYKEVPINIDNGSLGAAVADYMELENWNVNRINFGGKPEDPEHYEDIATEMYFNLRDQLESINIPKDDEELRGQLIQRKYEYINGRRGYEVMKIESKDQFKEHATGINKSPDRADALALCYYQTEDTFMFGIEEAVDVY